MRWVIIGLAAACAVVVGAVSYRTAATTSDDPEAWRQRELAFLKSVHDRIEADLAHHSGDGEASLRQEEHAVAEALTTTASRMPADRIPAEIRKVLIVALPKENAPAAPVNAEPPPPAAPVNAEPPPAAPLPAADEVVAAPPPPAVTDAAKPSLEEPTPPPLVREANLTGPPLEGLPPAPAEQPDLAQLEAAVQADKTKRGLRIRMPAAVLFGRARETLDSSADGWLSAIAELVAAMEPLEIVVIGRDDTVDLARQRAHAVAAWLTAHQSPTAPPHLIEQADKPTPAEDRAEGADTPAKRLAPGRIEILLRRR